MRPEPTTALLHTQCRVSKHNAALHCNTSFNKALSHTEVSITIALLKATLYRLWPVIEFYKSMTPTYHYKYYKSWAFSLMASFICIMVFWILFNQIQLFLYSTSLGASLSMKTAYICLALVCSLVWDSVVLKSSQANQNSMFSSLNSVRRNWVKISTPSKKKYKWYHIYKCVHVINKCIIYTYERI